MADEACSITDLPATGLEPSSRVTVTAPVGCGPFEGASGHDRRRGRHGRIGGGDGEGPESDAHTQADESATLSVVSVAE